MTTREAEGLPVIVFIPIIICFICIFVLLDIRKKLKDPQINTPIYQDDDDLVPITPPHESSEDEVPTASSSSTLHIRKIGKKRGEKLKRKEQMRQYREYMDQQREIRRAQEEVAEEQFRQRKMEESIRNQDELQRLRKEKEKRAKQEQKEESKRQQLQEKDAKKKQARFGKYSHKVKQWVQRTKLCDLNELAQSVGLSKEDVIDILKQLCAQDDEFNLSLWSGEDMFLFVTPEDYKRLNQLFRDQGKLSVQQDDQIIIQSLFEK